MKKILLLWVFLTTITACQHRAAMRPQAESLLPTHTAQTGSRYLQVSPFSQIQVSGPVNLEIIGALEKQDIRAIGNQSVLPHLRAFVEGHTLYLTADTDVPEDKLLVIIRTRDLFKLVYQGSGDVKAIGLDSPMLDVSVDTPGRVSLSGKHMALQKLALAGSGRVDINGLATRNLNIRARGRNAVHLHGFAELHDLNFSGEGWLSLYWVNSPYLKVRGHDGGYVQLAGKVGTLDAELFDQAQMNARYLRTGRSYVKTHQEARADIHVTDQQYTLASDHSNIYEYNDAKHKSNFMAHRGTVLNVASVSG